ncbi:MAG TPA: 50S ribosomal protein L2 [Phycisphaerae bacterium]|nr:50S ribosomal protein L2 [Phycisphaerae bacterium]
MGVKKYRPTSAGRRQSSVNDFAELTDKRRKPTKALLEPKRKTGGRNHSGKITSWWRGGGHKRMYRIIDFKRRADIGPATVIAIEYDPNRSCHIALIEYSDKTKSYILAPAGLKAGDRVESGDRVEPKAGNCMPLKNIPVGMDVHNIEMTAGQGGKLVRSAGLAARLVAREGEWATLLLPSGEMRQVRVECRATLGTLGNADHMHVRIGKAGRKRHMGRRPHNRGTSMNPVAHPLGGGEGRSGGGRHPCSAWGKPAKGGRTRSPRKNSNKRILRRRRSVRYGQLVLPKKK